VAKKIKTVVKLQVKAGQANPAPPVGPALGQHGLNIMDFCQKFNEQTKKMEPEALIPTEITVYEDRTFVFKIKTSPASYLLKKAAKIEKGSGNTPKDKVGKVTLSQIREIAEKKMPDLSARNIDEAIKIIEGTARSMGIEVVK